MRGLKVLAIVVVIAVVVTVISFVTTINFFAPRSQSSPDFLVSNVNGKVRKHLGGRYLIASDFLLTFDIQNNGTANATNIVGTVKYEKNGEWTTVDLHLNKLKNELVVGEKVSGNYAVFWSTDVAPSKNFVITISCDEGVSREINVTIP